MGQIHVTWGKFRLDVPGEIFLFLLFRAASFFIHYVNS